MWNRGKEWGGSMWSKKESITPPQWMLIGFAIIILIGAILLSTTWATSSGNTIDFIDALFTATSAVCVTGLTVLDTGHDFSWFGQMIILLLIQVGGLGFMTFSVMFAIALGKKIGFHQRILIQESTRAESYGGLVRLVKWIFYVTLAFEAIAAVILTLRWSAELGLFKAAYYALFHAISAFNNAGFSLWSNNLMDYVNDPVVNLVITSLFIIGGIGFIVLLDIFYKDRWQRYSLHSKITLVGTLLLMILGTLVVYLFEFHNPKTLGALTWDGKLWGAYFQGVVTRTAGFNTIDISSMLAPTQLTMVFLMFIGASSGSTGGGIKVSTFFILLFTVLSVARGESEVHVFQRRIAHDLILRAVAVIIISTTVVLGISLLLTITEHALQRDFLEILFEVTSAFGTVGLTMGLTPDLSSMGKGLIIVCMYIGRLGPLTLAYALALKRSKAKIRYAEEKILIG